MVCKIFQQIRGEDEANIQQRMVGISVDEERNDLSPTFPHAKRRPPGVS